MGALCTPPVAGPPITAGGLFSQPGRANVTSSPAFFGDTRAIPLVKPSDELARPRHHPLRIRARLPDIAPGMAGRQDRYQQPPRPCHPMQARDAARATTLRLTALVRGHCTVSGAGEAAGYHRIKRRHRTYHPTRHTGLIRLSQAINATRDTQ